VLVEGGLMCSWQVDDAEPPHAQTRALFDENAFVIGPTVDHALTHLMNRGGINLLVCAADDSRDSTHI